eukprot:COSAG04_NODE_2038_length_4951_cov_5.054823_1_plen_261_part_10
MSDNVVNEAKAQIGLRKLVSVTLFSGIGAFVNFRPLFLSHIISPAQVTPPHPAAPARHHHYFYLSPCNQIGQIMLIGSVITTFTNPVIAAFFDVMQAQKLLMLLSTTGLALTQLGMLLPGLGYRGMLVLCTLHSVIGAHNFPTFDASTTAVCPSRYGDIRLFGSAAFGVAAFGGGGLISLAGNAPARSTFSLAFILASALQLVSLPLITRIDFSALHASKKQTASTEATDATMAKEKPTGISALIRMAADPKMLYFMVIVF